MPADYLSQLKKIVSMLPERIALRIGDALSFGPVEEIRLRNGRPPQIVYFCGEQIIDDCIFKACDSETFLDRLCWHSVYAHSDELKRGFIAFEGGVRVGVCGRAVTENGSVARLSSVYGFNIRAAREVVGCAESILSFITDRGRPVSSLIAAPPGGGKTTLLRDVARCFSDGVGVPAVKVAIADERGELAGCSEGRPFYSVGIRTDVIDFAPKAEAVNMLIRTMSPQVIVTDEIGNKSDAEAISEAARCGVAVIASAHAASGDDLLKREPIGETVRSGTFERILILKRNGGTLHISPVKL